MQHAAPWATQEAGKPLLAVHSDSIRAGRVGGAPKALGYPARDGGQPGLPTPTRVEEVERQPGPRTFQVEDCNVKGANPIASQWPRKRWRVALVKVHHRHLRVGLLVSLSEKCPRGQLAQVAVGVCQYSRAPTLLCSPEDALGSWEEKGPEPRSLASGGSTSTSTCTQKQTKNAERQSKRAGRTNIPLGKNPARLG